MQSSAGPAVIPPSARLAGIVLVVVDLCRRIVVVVVVVERLPLCRGSLSSSGQCRRYGVRCGAGAEVEKRGTGALAERIERVTGLRTGQGRAKTRRPRRAIQSGAYDSFCSLVVVVVAVYLGQLGCWSAGARWLVVVDVAVVDGGRLEDR